MLAQTSSAITSAGIEFLALDQIMRCNGFKREKGFHQTDMQRVPGLQFSGSEVLDRQ